MIQPVQAAATSQVSPASQASASSAANALASLTQGNTFLDLLVAQLKNQDPTNPLSTNQLMAQTAELAQVQTLTAMSNQQSQATSDMATLAATGLMGKQVAGQDASGSKVDGQVDSVTVGSSGPILQLSSGASLPLSSVVSVTEPSSTTASSQSG